ncbi:MAG: hypothetical protein QM742_18105 [Aquabacterium sp.]
MALCTSFFGRKPVIHLLDADGGQSLAQLTLEAGGLLGGIYGYLDQQDRMVMVDGQQNLNSRSGPHATLAVVAGGQHVAHRH